MTITSKQLSVAHRPSFDDRVATPADHAAEARDKHAKATSPAIAAKYRSLDDLAIYAGVSAKTLRREAARGNLTTYTIAGRRLSTTADVDAMMARGRNRKPKAGSRGVYDRRNGGEAAE